MTWHAAGSARIRIYWRTSCCTEQLCHGRGNWWGLTTSPSDAQITVSSISAVSEGGPGRYVSFPDPSALGTVGKLLKVTSDAKGRFSLPRDSDDHGRRAIDQRAGTVPRGLQQLQPAAG